jgi:hypothetical protein
MVYGRNKQEKKKLKKKKKLKIKRGYFFYFSHIISQPVQRNAINRSIISTCSGPEWSQGGDGPPSQTSAEWGRHQWRLHQQTLDFTALSRTSG